MWDSLALTQEPGIHSCLLAQSPSCVPPFSKAGRSFADWGSKISHCKCSSHHAQQIKAKEAVKCYGPLPLSWRRLSVMRAKLAFNRI